MATRNSTPGLVDDTVATLRALFSHQAYGSTADRVHSALSEAIVNRILTPGTRLAEGSLAEIFNVSRTPVRETLLRLELEALAERDRQGGLFVSRIEVEQIIELYVVREALDGAAAHLAASQASVLELQQMRNINEDLAEAAREERFADMAELNIEFHSVLARASGNAMLENFIAQIHRFVRRFKTTTFSYPERAMAAVSEHNSILAALEDRDGSLAESLARDHMRQALDIRILMETSRSQPRSANARSDAGSD